MDGYIKLYRSLTEWEWYKDHNTLIVWIHLLCTANWKAGRFKGIDVPAGSLITTYRRLADETGLTVQQIRTSINRLKSTHEITQQSTQHGTLINIEKWRDFQTDELRINTIINTTINNQLTHDQHTINTDRRKKEIKEGKIITACRAREEFRYVSKDTPLTDERAVSIENSIRRIKGEEEIEYKT